MTVNDFVRAIKVQTSDAAVRGMIRSLTRPPGRKPSDHLVRLSGWYNQFDDADRLMLTEALKEAAEMAVFEFFCVLDGVSVVEDTAEKGELVLDFIDGAGRVRLNDPHEEELHNLYNGICRDDPRVSIKDAQLNPYDSGEAQRLKSKLVSGDDLDLHHVPDKYSSMRSIKDYDSKTGSAIVLPKHEHRQISPS